MSDRFSVSEKVTVDISGFFAESESEYHLIHFLSTLKKTH